jgi:hypothetical protein
MTKGHFHSRIAKHLTWLMLAGIMLLIANRMLFVHSHQLPDGTVVIHAHPFKTSQDKSEPAGSHQHTKYEFLLLNNLAHFIVVSAALSFIAYQKPQIRIQSRCYFHAPRAVVFHPSLRAPPAR